MNWQDVVKVCGSIVVSLGGGGAIVYGMSGFLGKLWAERGLQEDRQKYVQLNLQMESELHNAGQRLQAELDKFGFINKLRIEGEFQRLAVLWRNFANLSFAFNNASGGGLRFLPESPQAQEEYKSRRRREFQATLHDTQQALYEEMVFIPRQIADLAGDTLSHALKENNLYMMFAQEPIPENQKFFYKHSALALEQFKEGMNSLETAIREHIRDSTQ